MNEIADPIAEVCPRCAAGIGSKCTSGGRPVRWYHAARIDAAEGLSRAERLGLRPRVVKPGDPSLLKFASPGMVGLEIEVRVHHDVWVVEIDSNAPVDVDAYGETMAIMRDGRIAEWG